MKNNLIPIVVERENNSERSYDLYSKMLKDRIIFLQGEITDAMANTIVLQLLHLESENPTAPIYMYINSPGGSVTAGLAIKDTMDYIECPVYTIGLGMCASMGAFLLASGEHGYRYALKNTSIMIHQVLGGAQGQVTDMEIRVNFSKSLKDKLNKYLSEYTKGKTDYNTMVNLCERDNFLTPSEAKHIGLIDHVVNSKKDIMEEVENEM